MTTGATTTSGTVKWYYYLTHDPRGQPDGWYEYDHFVNQQVEQLFQSQQHVSKRARQLLPFATSSGYQYEIDFQNMTQRNVTSGKQRPIGRTTNGLPPDQQHLTASAVGASGTASMFGVPFGTGATATATSAAAAAAAAATAAAMAMPSGAFAAPFGGPIPGAPVGVSAPFRFVPFAGSASFAHTIPAAASAAAVPTARTGRRPGVWATKNGDTLYYTAPDVLHEIHVDEAKVFVDVTPPTGKPKAVSTGSEGGREEEKKQTDSATSSYASSDHDDDCVICLDQLWNSTGGVRVVSLTGCKHKFHYDCIHEALTKMGGKCPLCSKSVQEDNVDTQTSKGKCPSGTMDVSKSRSPCGGYPHAGTIRINYHIHGGTQKSYHPHPGISFSGACRTAYLPDITEGRDLLARMQYAFCHGLSFMVGTSLTTSQPNVVTWASIHHKTSRSGGTYGFPDDSYFDRCNDELNQLGIPPAAECRQWIENL